MKSLIAGLMLATVATVAGCSKEGSAGGPGAADPNVKPPLVGQAENTFTLTASSLEVKPGGTTPSSIGISRGAKFDQDVTLEFADLPKGVSIDPAKPVLPNKASETKFNVAATDDAAPGNYTVRLAGHPATGPDAKNEIKLTVAKKDTFTLGVPFWTTGVKQGETRNFAVSISRDKTFDQDVTLKFDGLPTGVTIEPAKPVIKNGETEAKLSLKAADDAPVGDHVIKITGHPTKGADASHDLKFTVTKK